MAINIKHINWLKLFFGTSLVVVIGATIVLIREYHYFRKQAEKTVALQSEYKNYVVAVRKLLRGTSFIASDTEKKNDKKLGTHILVNRNPGHLKKMSHSFFRCHHMMDVFNRIPEHEWLDYSGQLLRELSVSNTHKKSVQSVKSVKARTKRRRKKYYATAHASRCTRKKHFSLPIATPSSKIFSWPLDPVLFYISSVFGPRKNPRGWKFHRGLDMASMRGTPVKAAAAGKVIQTFNDAHGYGNIVKLAHDNQYQTWYAHLDKILVTSGQQVERGTIIGRVGATGNVRKMGFDGSHLHFEVRIDDNAVNPLNYLG